MAFRLIRAGIGPILISMGAACGGSSPVAPAPSPSSPASLLPAGRYNLGTSGGESLPGGAGFAGGCSGAVADWGLLGVIVAPNIVLQPDQNGWVGSTASTEEGDIELRLQQIAGNDGEVQVRGTVRGTGVHFLDLVFAAGSRKRVAFAGSGGESAASVEGRMTPGLPGLIATAAGTISFTDAGAHAVTCPKASLLLVQVR